jgi:cytochrome c
MNPATRILLAVATSVGLGGLLAAAPPPGDAAAGKLLYARCVGCHSPNRNRTGPRHCELFGRVSGTLPGYDYSEAMREAAIRWNAESLDRFLTSPMSAVPGTSMGFAGIAEASERRDLVASLAGLTAAAAECRGSR